MEAAPIVDLQCLVGMTTRSHYQISENVDPLQEPSYSTVSHYDVLLVVVEVHLHGGQKVGFRHIRSRMIRRVFCRLHNQQQLHQQLHLCQLPNHPVEENLLYDPPKLTSEQCGLQEALRSLLGPVDRMPDCAPCFDLCVED